MAVESVEPACLFTKFLSTLQEHVKATKTDKTRFFFAKKDVTRQTIVH